MNGADQHSDGTFCRSGDPVLVCGAGAAGLAASLAAARAGANVWLIETSPQIGGTVTNVLIHTLAGFFDNAGELLNEGLPAELIEKLESADTVVRRRRMGRVWVLQVSPQLYGRVVEEWIRAEPRIRLLLNTRVTQLQVHDGLITQVEISHEGVQQYARPRSVIDATGTGEVVRQIDPALVEDDPLRAAGGLVFVLGGVHPRTLDLPGGLGVIRVVRDAAASGRLPAECRHAWLDVGTADDEVYVKLFLPRSAGLRNPSQEEQLATRGNRLKDSIFEVLHSVAGFERATIERVGRPGIRDGGRVCGEYCLQVSEVRNAARFPDVACRCCWPIEYWDPEHGLSLEHLPDGSYYEIPLRALTLKGYRNVWTAGKSLSADRFAQASARVVGSCWGMGEAVGRAATLA